MKGVNLQMNPVLKDSGEIDLIVNKEKTVQTDALEDWQVDQMLGTIEETDTHNHRCLMEIEDILDDWINNLEPKDWAKMRRQQSLWGIKLPENWVKVWRFILKNPSLRDAERSVANGRRIGTYTHLWNLWAEQCIDEYLNDLEKQLLWYVDNGYLYQEIGELMLAQYGEDFWKPRKKNSKTTPAQVVNNYLYWKMPNKIVRCELWELCKVKMRLYDQKKEKKKIEKVSEKILIG